MSVEFETDGIHWTPDLASEFQISFNPTSNSPDAKSPAITLDLVEAGTHYYCEIDLTDGKATLSAVRNDDPLKVFENNDGDFIEHPTAQTKLRAHGEHTIKYANVDNTIHLWIDNSHIAFTPSSRIQSDSLAKNDDHRPRSTAADPLDAAPVGIGLRGVTAQLSAARVWRDVYYIAMNSVYRYLLDNQNYVADLTQSVSMTELRDYLKQTYGNVPTRDFSSHADFRDALFSTPSIWDRSSLFTNRNVVDFRLGEDHFFPMGDNSAASSDARVWSEGFVPRRLLIGRAVVVFWPHPWVNPPLPNFSRMSLIR